jgi:hypothetical protein
MPLHSTGESAKNNQDVCEECMMSMSVEVDGRMIDVTYPRSVSAKDRKLIRKQLEIGWNAYVDAECAELETSLPDISPLAAKVFASARLVRRLFVPREKMKADEQEVYRVGKFNVAIIGSSCPTQRSLVVSVSCGKHLFAEVAEYANPFGGPHWDAIRFTKRSPLNTEFIEAVRKFTLAARTDPRRIVIFNSLNHVAFAAYPQFLQKSLWK